MFPRLACFSRLKHRQHFKECSSAIGKIESVYHILDKDSNEAAEIVIDARMTLGRLHNRRKQSFTGKEIEEKIVFNSIIDSTMDRLKFNDRVKKAKKEGSREFKKQREELLNRGVSSIAAALIVNSSSENGSIPLENNSTKPSNIQPEELVKFPYSSFVGINQKYEKLKELHGEILQPLTEDDFDYGTANPSIPVSDVPCGGCGALLHCQSSSVPGYLPREVFTTKTKHQLRGQICQRCRFLREHDVALNIQISPDDYPKVLSVIRDQVAMVVLIVDLLDFPCSIWPGLMDIIGDKRPVCVVGNKVDLLPKDSPNYLQQIKNSLVKSLESHGLKRANIKEVCLISATTGYGVETLITKIQHSWAYRGDVYLMGCTNVGKSSLFNALIQSDFCKTQAIDLLQRATVSPWPGTTLNLLKFPMLRPSSIRLRERFMRIKSEANIRKEEEQLRRERLRATKDPKYATLIGHIGRTFNVKREDFADSFAIRADKVPSESENFFNPRHNTFAESKWCYDTPGTVSHDQILTLLTLEELMKMNTNDMIKPRTVSVKPGFSYFLAGLARIDYLEGPDSIKMTTFASKHLPITLIEQEYAEQLYKELLGTRLLAVPCGGQERLKLWPGLSGREMSFKGIGKKRSAVDILLSSAGWVALTGKEEIEYQLKVHTPEGRGIYIRDPPILPYAVNLRGKRIARTPSYTNDRLYIN